MTYKLRAISRHSNLPAWPLNGIPNSSSEQVKFGKKYRYRGTFKSRKKISFRFYVITEIGMKIARCQRCVKLKRKNL